MDEYAGGVSAQFTTNEALLGAGMELLAFLKEDSEKLAAAESARADAVLGEHPPHVAGRGPRAHGAVP